MKANIRKQKINQRKAKIRKRKINQRKFGPKSYLEESAAELAGDGVNYVGTVGARLQKSQGLGFRVWGLGYVEYSPHLTRIRV